MFDWLLDCDECIGKGKVVGMGGMEKECAKCKCRKATWNSINKIKNWLFNNPFKVTPVEMAISFFVLISIVLSIMSLFHYSPEIFSALVASFGGIFVALKYKLDQANYHKALFEERYAIFRKFDEIISDTINNRKGWRELVEEMDSVYRKSYFLFGKETYQFISELRLAVAEVSHSRKGGTISTSLEERAGKALEFLIGILDGQNLSEKFPELKIDAY